MNLTPCDRILWAHAPSPHGPSRAPYLQVSLVTILPRTLWELLSIQVGFLLSRASLRCYAPLTAPTFPRGESPPPGRKTPAWGMLSSSCLWHSCSSQRRATLARLTGSNGGVLTVTSRAPAKSLPRSGATTRVRWARRDRQRGIDLGSEWRTGIEVK